MKSDKTKSVRERRKKGRRALWSWKVKEYVAMSTLSLGLAGLIICGVEIAPQRV